LFTKKLPSKILWNDPSTKRLRNLYLNFFSSCCTIYFISLHSFYTFFITHKVLKVVRKSRITSSLRKYVNSGNYHLSKSPFIDAAKLQKCKQFFPIWEFLRQLFEFKLSLNVNNCKGLIFIWNVEHMEQLCGVITTQRRLHARLMFHNLEKRE
jgi:hypothetical protein